MARNGSLLHVNVGRGSCQVAYVDSIVKVVVHALVVITVARHSSVGACHTCHVSVCNCCLAAIVDYERVKHSGPHSLSTHGTSQCIDSVDC